MQRKDVLQRLVTENDRIAVSRYIERQGIALYQAAEQRETGRHRGKAKRQCISDGKTEPGLDQVQAVWRMKISLSLDISGRKSHTYSLILAKYRKWASGIIKAM